MYIVRTTDVFDEWLKDVSDIIFQKRIQVRIDRISLGNLGDHKAVGDGIFELRMVFGPGFRVYYTIRDQVIVILLCGGDKSGQKEDIEYAKEIAKEL